MELEERSVEQLPDRCENCGTPLTAREKETALEEGATVVLCTTCATESSALPEEEADEFEPGA
jgi:protein-arginine kinase activator protein McsA